MNIIFTLIFVGVVISEIGGIWMIRLSRGQPNLSTFKKIGTFVCILGIGALVLGIIGLWAVTHQ